MDRRTRWLIEDSIVILLAGVEAEANFSGKRNHVGARSDYDVAADLALRVCGSSEQSDAYLAYLKVCARDAVKSPPFGCRL
jgi:hypothetical protein